MRLDLGGKRLVGGQDLRDNRAMNQEPRLLLTTRNLELTDSIRFFVEEQLDKLFEHASQIERIRVELDLEKRSKTHAGEATIRPA